MENLTGKSLGQYQITSPIGEGGMAAVYKAYQPGMDRYVALKILPRHYANDPLFVKRFQQEAKIIASLQHPHILPVHDYGQEDGLIYIVMPLVEAGTLADMLTKGPLKLATIRKIMSQVGDALDYAHAQGVVHRDIKPSNILVDERGNCMLTDFGIGKLITRATALTNTGDIIGTPAYMSPEQGLGQELDGRSDIYSLGVMLFEMATGRPPFEADTPIAVIIKHIHDPLPSPRKLNPLVPESVEWVILKALAKDREKRFKTASETVGALEAAFTHAGLDPNQPFPSTQVHLGNQDLGEPEDSKSEPGQSLQENETIPASAGKRGISGRLGTILAVIGILAILSAVALVWTMGWFNSGGVGLGVGVVQIIETLQLTVTPVVVTPEPDTPEPTETPTGTPTKTPTPTSSPTPTRTFMPSKTPTPEVVVSSLGGCGQDEDEPCIYASGITSGLQLITLKFPFPPGFLIYLIINQDRFDCTTVDTRPEMFYCTGPLQTINKKLSVWVYRASDNLLLSEGVTTFYEPPTATPPPTKEAKEPKPEEEQPSHPGYP